uniref:Cation/H+ exchanger transmembrane domain-containing protein n=1 Tax=Fagus sylvatica TaxID=28930 RepID=A0A2N9IFQ4_FAGSY
MGEPLKETYVIVVFVAVLVSGFCCQAAGLNIYYGPFVLGITIPPGPPVGSVITEKLEFITTWIFMPLYFVKNGLLIDIFAVKFQNYLAVQFIALVAAFGKFLAAFMISFYCNMPLRDAMAIGTCHECPRYMVYKRRTVMHLRPDSELRILVCIHDQENVPTIINLLEALNPSKRSPLSIYLLHLIELVGRANPLLITHKLTKRPSSKASPSEPIVNAFRYYEHSSHGLVTVFPFTAISHCKTMHDDVCSLALDKRTSLIIVPFYKDIHANGARMAGHPNISLTVIRFLENESVASGNEEERKLDSEVVSEFRLSMAGNYHVMYIEEVVTDGTGTISVIRSMENNYELILVGRRHDRRSPLISGLVDWNEQVELGAIGEVLTSADFLGNTTILVVQQQTNIVNDGNNNNMETFGEQNVVEDDAEDMPIS